MSGGRGAGRGAGSAGRGSVGRGALRPIPVRLLPDSCEVRELGADGVLAAGVVLRHVRFERKDKCGADGALSVTGTLFIDAANTVGAREIAAGSVVVIGSDEMVVRSCVRCCDVAGHVHHWELALDSGEVERAVLRADTGSIVYGGVDFSPFSVAEVEMPAGHGVGVEAVAMPGRAGARLRTLALEPLEIKVKLTLKAEALDGLDAAGLMALRREVRAALAAGGCVLELPQEPGICWHDVVCTSAGAWSDLFDAGECELTFKAYDPVAWGEEREVVDVPFEVGGTWPTWPVFTLTCKTACSTCFVSLDGMELGLTGSFAAGDVVVLDCAHMRATLNNSDAASRVALTSTFFALTPGTKNIFLSSSWDFSAKFSERWL